LANFMVKSLIVKAMAMVRANWIVKTANTLIHTVSILEQYKQKGEIGDANIILFDESLTMYPPLRIDTYLCISMQLHH
jgi:hypothetical protein